MTLEGLRDHIEGLDCDSLSFGIFTSTSINPDGGVDVRCGCPLSEVFRKVKGYYPFEGQEEIAQGLDLPIREVRLFVEKYDKRCFQHYKGYMGTITGEHGKAHALHVIDAIFSQRRCNHDV